jgi:hypothetical protein
VQEFVQESKNPGEKPRARGKEKSQVSQYVAKVYKKAAQIADLMTGEDVEAHLKVLRDAKKACHHIYDTKKKLVKVPDHKTRLAANNIVQGLSRRETCRAVDRRSDRFG